MTEQTFRPLTETLLEQLKEVGSPDTIITAAEGVDLMRLLTAEGNRELVQGMSMMVAGDPTMAALTINILLKVACRGDELLQKGVANFDSLPEDVKAAARATVPSE